MVQQTRADQELVKEHQLQNFISGVDKWWIKIINVDHVLMGINKL